MRGRQLHVGTINWPNTDGTEKRRKYRNIPTTDAAGRAHPSKAQARHADALDAQVKAGLIRGWIPEVSIPLPWPFEGQRMRLDALVIHNDGQYRWQDVKGAPPTDIWLKKRKVAEDHYGITIEIVSRTR